MNEQES